MSLRWKTKYILAKIETTYGTDSAPVAATDGVLAQNITLRPMQGEDAPRNLERPFLAADETIPVNVHAQLDFSVELAPSGTAGTAPAWAPLLRACGVGQTVSAGVSVTFAPATDNHASATIHFFVEGTRHVLTGARGNARFVIGAQAIPRIEFAFTGLYNVPSEQSRTNPTLSSWQRPQPATRTNTPTFTVNSVASQLRELTFDLGNQVVPRLLIGAESIIIPDRAETLSARIGSVPLSTLNPFALAAALTPVPVGLVHGVGAGRIATFSWPLAQLRRPPEPAVQDQIVEWPLTFAPQPNSGNDQWSLVLT